MLVKESVMKKGLTVFAVTSAVLLFAASSFAQPFQRMRPGMDRMERGPARVLFALKAHQKELKITDDQLKQIESLAFAFEEKMIAMESESRSSHLGIRKLMMDRENIDFAKIKAALDKASDQRNEMLIARLKHHDEIMKVLTPEQREAVKSAIRDRIGERGDFLRERGFPGDRGFRRFPRFSEPDFPFPDEPSFPEPDEEQ